MTNRILVVVVFGFVLSAARLLMGGPESDRPLSMDPAAEAGPQPLAEGPDQPQPAAGQAYYWSHGQKIPLNDTGLAVAKLKAGVDINARPEVLNFRPLALAESRGIGEQLEKLRQSGMVVLSTRGGPGALNRKALSDQPPAAVEYMLPVVKPAVIPAPPQEQRPAVAGADARNGPRPANEPDRANAAAPPPAAVAQAGEKSALIMTPMISARFKRDMVRAQVDEYIRPMGLKVKRQQEDVPGGYVLELSEGPITYVRLLKGANDLYEKGNPDKTVILSHPNCIPARQRYEAPAPGDPRFGDQWHLNNTGQGNGTPNADVRAIEAWKVTEGKPEIIVAIIDDSVEMSHPDLASNWQAGRYYDGANDTYTNDPSPKDSTQRHGTSCAGVAVAAGNSVCGRGAAPGCKLIGVNFWNATTAQTAEAFYYANAKGAAIMSNSWSWGAAFDDVSLAINDLAVNGRNGKGSVILFAAGNEYSTIYAQQAFGQLRGVITVGATNWRDDHSKYSNTGPELCVVAPSSDSDTLGALGITTTDNTENMPKPDSGFSGYSLGDCTNRFGGTSSATPLTAGVCALVLSVNPNLKSSEVRAILEDSADKIPGVTQPGSYNQIDKWGKGNHSLYYGHGRVNAKKAVDLAAKPGGGTGGGSSGSRDK